MLLAAQAEPVCHPLTEYFMLVVYETDFHLREPGQYLFDLIEWFALTGAGQAQNGEDIV